MHSRRAQCRVTKSSSLFRYFERELIAHQYRWLIVCIGIAIAGRIGAWLILAPEVESDSLAYLTMAQAIVATGIPHDNFGQLAFYSIGYPYFLAPFVYLLGASSQSVLIANLLLTATTMVLLWVIARDIGMTAIFRLIAVAIYAAWLPAIWTATLVAKENLSIPLLLLVCYASLSILRAVRLAPLGAGLSYGAALLTGGSSLLLFIPAMLALLIMQKFAFKTLLLGSLSFLAGALLLLAPWGLITKDQLGQPMLTSNSGFNLYLGNNPVATGEFVSIADTPAGPEWENMRKELGEAGASNALAEQAKTYIFAHPQRSAILAAKKLYLFWQPNFPDQADLKAGAAIFVLRYAEIVQYIAILAAGLVGLVWAPISSKKKAIFISFILAFWVIHAATYIIPRYRDPIVPILIIFAASSFARSRNAWKPAVQYGK